MLMRTPTSITSPVPLLTCPWNCGALFANTELVSTC